MRNKNTPNKNQTTETDESNCKPQSLCKHLTFSAFIFTSLDFIFSTDAYFINPVNLFKFLQEHKLAIAQGTQEQVDKFGQIVLDKFLHQIQDKCNETERKIRKVDSYISIPYTAFYILIIILIALSSFFVRHDSSKHRDITFKSYLESCYLLCPYCNFGVCNDDSRA